MTKLPSQIAAAYRVMAAEARYRPGAPSDGFGTITGPLDLDAETRRYAKQWNADEDRMEYFLGCPSSLDRPALIWTVEAARLICGVQRKPAARLLRLAADALDATQAEEDRALRRLNDPSGVDA